MRFWLVYPTILSALKVAKGLTIFLSYCRIRKVQIWNGFLWKNYGCLFWQNFLYKLTHVLSLKFQSTFLERSCSTLKVTFKRVFWPKCSYINMLISFYSLFAILLCKIARNQKPHLCYIPWPFQHWAEKFING